MGKRYDAVATFYQYDEDAPFARHLVRWEMNDVSEADVHLDFSPYQRPAVVFLAHGDRMLYLTLSDFVSLELTLRGEETPLHG